MLKAEAETKSFADAFVPRFSVAGFGVKDDATADGAKWGGTKIERAV